MGSFGTLFVMVTPRTLRKFRSVGIFVICSPFLCLNCPDYYAIIEAHITVSFASTINTEHCRPMLHRFTYVDFILVLFEYKLSITL